MRSSETRRIDGVDGVRVTDTTLELDEDLTVEGWRAALDQLAVTEGR
jgi:hypothetical protein